MDRLTKRLVLGYQTGLLGSEMCVFTANKKPTPVLGLLIGIKALI